MLSAIHSPPATDFDPHADESGTSAEESAESTGILGAVIDAFREEGYERGYARASQDVLDSLVAVAERFLRQSPGDDPGARKTVYAFVEILEREIQAASGDVAGYVSGGLGI